MLLLIRHPEDFFHHASVEQSYSDCMVVRAATGQESDHRGEPALARRLATWLDANPALRAQAMRATSGCCGLCQVRGCRLRSVPMTDRAPPAMLAMQHGAAPAAQGRAGPA